ncbi:TlpA family protein disulfide reductase [Streptomyces sp. NPDC093225]|uniref:TlpA family protein disulfide reductase n=1 Tax=Streptomyces sp. NPDC093225 TaxID=3366034 RepID=UPI00380C514A
MRRPAAATALLARLAALPLLLATTSGCGPGDTVSSHPGVFGPPGARAAATVPDSLRFTVRTVDGQPFDGTSLAGKPVLLWFYTPTCAPCPAQAFETAARADRYTGRLNVVAVTEPDGHAGSGLQGFTLPSNGVPLPHLADAGHVLRDRFEVEGASSYVLVDAHGKLLHQGPAADTDALDRELTVLLGPN